MIELDLDSYEYRKMCFDPREVTRYQEGGRSQSSGLGSTVIVTFRDGSTISFLTGYETFKRLMESAAKEEASHADG